MRVLIKNYLKPSAKEAVLEYERANHLGRTTSTFHYARIGNYAKLVRRTNERERQYGYFFSVVQGILQVVGQCCRQICLPSIYWFMFVCLP